MNTRRALLFLLAVCGAFPSSLPAAEKPNILVIFGDDIGQSNVSAYSRGLMGFTTPNIDRIGNEGGVFVNYYGQQSCTAGRAAFICGQCPFRTGLTKVGQGGGVDGEDIIVHRVPLDGIEDFVAAKRAEGCGIDVRVAMLLAGGLLA